ncbi:hypothetical protein [Bdellovibrio bacteriovorus]|uniref:hypothetical protein n=1 Tax=Bdellovibrio bacteriovorus TaxID=959 RepID=UPI0012FBA6F0|nr:hypothetical protein [Bdellovibrio bacteriovorus]
MAESHGSRHRGAGKGPAAQEAKQPLQRKNLVRMTYLTSNSAEGSKRSLKALAKNYLI